jgi:hypothetical protein
LDSAVAAETTLTVATADGGWEQTFSTIHGMAVAVPPFPVRLDASRQFKVKARSGGSSGFGEIKIDVVGYDS